MASGFYIEAAGRKVEAEFLADKAPGICRAMTKCLPMESTGLHAKFAGQEIIVMVPFFAEAENEILNVEPGDIGYYPGRQTICIFYGDTKPFGYVSVFAKVRNGVQDLHTIGNEILEKGVIPVKLSSSNKGSDGR